MEKGSHGNCSSGETLVGASFNSIIGNATLDAFWTINVHQAHYYAFQWNIQQQKMPARILIDSKFDDWETVSPTHSDPLDDAPPGAIDFGQY